MNRSEDDVRIGGCGGLETAIWIAMILLLITIIGVMAVRGLFWVYGFL